MFYQEAQAVLYSDNLLALLDLDTSCFDSRMLFNFAKSVPYNVLHPDTPIPPAAVHIKHGISDNGSENICVVFAAVDTDLVCHALHQTRWCYGSVHEDWSITVLKAPRHGWTFDQLKKYIWDPLRRRYLGEYSHVRDRTGVFETQTEKSDTKGSSDIEKYSDGDSDGDSDDDDDDDDEDRDGDGHENKNEDDDGDGNEDEEGDTDGSRATKVREEKEKGMWVSSGDQGAV